MAELAGTTVNQVACELEAEVSERHLNSDILDRVFPPNQCDDTHVEREPYRTGILPVAVANTLPQTPCQRVSEIQRKASTRRKTLLTRAAVTAVGLYLYSRVKR